jgi:TonB dependent receptor/CarboxypepD_reg-like domain/TonB-dependent Receptor Plug Domain
MRIFLGLVLTLLVSAPLAAQEPKLPAEGATAPHAVRGRVVDARTGEPLAKALVSIRRLEIESVTDAKGLFVLENVPAGAAEISVTTVDYGVEKKAIVVGPDLGDVEIHIGQESLRRFEKVTVTTAPFEPEDGAAPTAHTLGGTELKNLANVLVDDPLRSVQSLPGIAANDDFGATFAARGLGFANVGLYVDGVLLNAPFHTIRDVNDGFSLTLLNGDVVDSMSVVTGGAPAKYGDRTGSVLDVKTRDGSGEDFVGRASLGATGVYATLEGPIGAAKKTSWLVSARKSYLDYVLARLDEESLVLGYYDAAAKLTHRASSAHVFSLGFLHGRSSWRSTEADLQPQDGHTADAGTDLATLQWRFLPSPRGWLHSVAFASRESGRNRTLDSTDTFRSVSTQWGLRLDAARVFGRHRLEAGLLVRSLSEEAVAREFVSRAGSWVTTEDYDARSAEGGVFVQDTWTGLGDRLTLTLGGRLERFEETSETRVLPRASLAWGVSGKTRLLAAFGSYSQFPAFGQLYGRHGNPELDAERATQALVAVEHNLGASTRVRVEAYDQRMTGIAFNPATDWRVEDDRIVAPRPGAPLENALSGPSRGLEVLVQRRSANGLSGWVAYSFGHARVHEDGGGLELDTDFDQRHTLTVFGSYRVSHTLNLSTKYRYGSGFPFPGFYEARSDGVYLSSERNLYRPESYSRWDIRANKAFVFTGWKLTVYGEVINVLNRTHTRYTDLDGIDGRTRRVFFETDTLFPLLPSVGVVVEF